MKIKYINICCFAIVSILFYLFYRYNLSYSWFFFVEIKLRLFDTIFYQWNFKPIFDYLFFVYFIWYIFYYLIFSSSYNKCYYFLSFFLNIFYYIKTPFLYCPSKIEKDSVLNILVKWFFLPLMFFWTFLNISNFLNAFSNSIVYINTNYNSFYELYRLHLHWMIFYWLLMIDVLIFLFWYTIELKYFNNIIKSVEPTLFWWLITLFCYPFLNDFTFKILWWYATDFPDFVKYYWWEIINYQLSIIFWIIFNIFMWIYVRASISLWFKASNLTNRWIVLKWPYKFVRHPAYISKNLARIVWALPFLYFIIDNWSKNNRQNWEILTLILIVFSLLGRSLIYHLRAVTEERHLALDSEYKEYLKKTKYMYIPKLF